MSTHNGMPRTWSHLRLSNAIFSVSSQQSAQQSARGGMHRSASSPAMIVTGAGAAATISLTALTLLSLPSAVAPEAPAFAPLMSVVQCSDDTDDTDTDNRQSQPGGDDKIKGREAAFCIATPPDVELVPEGGLSPPRIGTVLSCTRSRRGRDTCQSQQ